jgi:protein TonB
VSHLQPNNVQLKEFYFYLGALLSVVFSTLLFLFFLYIAYEKREVKKYRMTKDKVINVSLHTPIKEVKKVKPIVKKKVVNPKPPKPKKVIKKPKPKPKPKVEKKVVPKKSINSLFDTISTKKIDKTKSIEKKRTERIKVSDSVKKLLLENKKIVDDHNSSDEAKELLSELTLDQLEFDLKIIKNDDSDGEYNAYYAKVKEILARDWNPTSFTKGHKARVRVTISDHGVFTYRVLSYSESILFNQELDLHLEYLLSQQFPPYEGGAKTVIDVYLGTKD